VSLYTILRSRYNKRIGGAIELSGYLLRGKKLKREREGFISVRDRETRERIRVFLIYKTRDILVSIRVFRDIKSRVEKIVGEDIIEYREYKGIGHIINRIEFKDIYGFLKRVIPS
jgi:predicted esterase